MSVVKPGTEPALFKILTGFFLCASFTFVYPLLTLFLIEHGLSPTLAAQVQAAALLGSALMLPKMGAMLDQHRFRPVIAIAAVFIVGGIPLIAGHAIHHPFWAFVSSFVFLCGVGIVSTVTKRITEGLVAKEHLSKAASYTYLTENAAVGLSALLAYLFIADYRNLLASADILTTLGFIAYLFVLSRRMEPTNPAAPTPQPQIARFQDPSYNLTLAAIFLLLITVLCHASATPLLFLKAGLEPKSTTALMLIFNTLTVTSVSLLLAKGVLKIAPKKLFLLGAGFSSVGHFLVPYFLHPSGIAVTTVIWSIGEGLAYPAVAFLVIERFTKEHAGLAVGIRNLLWRGALVAAPLMASFIQTSGPETFGYLFGSLPIVAIVLFGISNRASVKKGLL